MIRLIGTLTWTYTYDAYGVQQNPDPLDGNAFRYAGQYFDTESGTYYLRARYYNPATGRFTQQDAWANANRGDPLGLNLYCYCVCNPVRYWDPSGEFWFEVGEIFKSFTRALTHEIDQFLSKNLWIDTAAWGAAILNMREDERGVYHANFDYWQSYFGYNDLYDIVFDLGTSMQAERFEFISDGQEYAFWAWKGDYINLGAGAEMGIYRRMKIAGIDTPHWIVDKDMSMSMTLTVTDSDGNIIIDYAPEDSQWWITGFNPQYKNWQANKLTATYTITFHSETLYNDFHSSILSNPRSSSKWSFDPSSYTATFVL